MAEPLVTLNCLLDMLNEGVEKTEKAESSIRVMYIISALAVTVKLQGSSHRTQTSTGTQRPEVTAHSSAIRTHMQKGSNGELKIMKSKSTLGVL